jgi:hypothetical protein
MSPGLCTLGPELSGKRLELLKETVPNLVRVATFGSSISQDYPLVIKELDLAGAALKLELQHFDIRIPKDVENAFRDAANGHAQAVFFRLPGPLFPATADRRSRGEVRIPTQIDTHSAGKTTLVPIEIGTCSDTNRHLCLG